MKKMWIRALCLLLVLVMAATALAACDSQPGPQGPAGEDGKDGLNGLDGNTWTVGSGVPHGNANSGDMYLDTLTNNVYQFNGNAWTQIACIQGADGTNGESGNKWYTGTVAPVAGSTYKQGDMYLDTVAANVYQYNGTAWTLLTNIDGEDGSNGENGTDGNKWYTGNGEPAASLTGMIAGDLYLDIANGDVYKYTTAWGKIGNIKGAAGANGQNGSNGSNGQNGTNGADGNKWYTGAVDPTAGEYLAGDMYLNTATFELFTYNGTAWGSLGVIKGADGENGSNGQNGTNGSNGQNGADGNKWYTGNGAPAASLTGMIAGDLYLDIISGDVYKYTTAWGKIGNIKGADGENGSNGQNGTHGENGTNGTNGEDGTEWFVAGGAPNNVEGAVKGDLYLDLNTGNVYKLDATWTLMGCIKGNDGANGENGSDGTTWTVGEGAPSAAAKQGDIYYDQLSGKLYQYQSSAWVEISKPLTEKEKELRELLTLKKELRAHEDGSFKVLMFSDIHFYSPADLQAGKSLQYINETIDRENPDLVLFAGDNWWDLSSEEEFRGYIEILVGHIEEKQIPWAHVFGNHDDENQPEGWTKSIHQSVQQRICEEFEYCVSKAGEQYLSGTGNYVLPVLSHDGSKILYNIWALDSGAYAHYIDNEYVNVKDTFENGEMNGEEKVKITNTFYGKYEGIQRNQVDWYVKTSQLLEEYNGEKIPAMMYFHIPLQETYTAWKMAYLYGVNGTMRGKVAESRYNDMVIVGTKNPDEGICAPAYNAGLFDAAVERGDVKLMAYGHDHIHDFAVKYQGINLCYIPAITTRENVTGNNNALMGGRVVELGKDFSTHMSYVDGSTTIDPNAPILDMTIGGNGSVCNDAAGPALTYHDFSASSGKENSVTYDQTLGRNVINFAGDSSFPNVYNLRLPKAKYTALLADGFSYEVTFKATAIPTSGYVGILDMEEAGGFGLNLYPDGKLYAELALSDAGWDKWIYTIDKDTWYHCVYVFDGTNTALYINGVKLTTDNAEHSVKTGDYRQPDFVSRSGEEYVCIGGCAQAWSQTTSGLKSNGEKGFAGSIAEVKLLPTVLTEEEIQELYETSGVYTPPAT